MIMVQLACNILLLFFSSKGHFEILIVTLPGHKLVHSEFIITQFTGYDKKKM